MPYRHGLDFLGDLAAAATNQAQDVAERRRAAAAEHAPASTVARPRSEEDELIEDTGLVARFLTNPVALTLAVFVVVALVGARDAFDSLAGGGLSPAPAAVGDWWRLQVETWHPLGTGTAVPAPPYVLPMALLATVLGGSPSAAVSAVMLLAVPLGLWGAWRFLRVVGRLVTPTGAPRTRAALGRDHLGARAGGERRVERRPVRRGRGGRDAAVAGARRARLRRARRRPALAGGLAHRAAARPRVGVRPGAVAVRRAARPGRASPPPS